MGKISEGYLPPREQQIMEIVYKAVGEGADGVSATEVMASLPTPLSNSAVRTFLRILEQKGHLQHEERDGRYLYLPVRPRQNAGRSALSRVLSTFYDNSVEKVMATLLSEKEAQLSTDELDRLQAMIDEARKQGR